MKNSKFDSSTTVICKRLHQIDMIAEEFPAWKDVRIVQTEPGAVCLDVLLAATKNFILTHTLVDRQFYHEGFTPSDYRTFIVPACEQRGAINRRQWYTHEQIVLAPASCETEGIGYSGLNLFHLSVHEDELQGLSRMANIDLEEVSKGDGAIFTPLPEAMESLRVLLWSVYSIIKNNPPNNWFPVAAEGLKTSLASCLGTSVHYKGYPALKRRDHTYKAVLKYMMGNLDSIVSVKDLCEAGNVSERTLLYIFRDRLDVTPKEFLQACKLRKVQQDLLSGEAKSVTDAATRWGFWHMGQFAADYRRMFGELPSATLKRRK